MVKQLTGAVNAQIEQIKLINNRLSQVESRVTPPQTPVTNLPTPRTEQDLIDIRKLPDSVRDLQVFDGNAVQYISWIHNVESILRNYEIVKTKPIYRAVLQHIRQKIRGPADAALISYNNFDEEWAIIKKCLSLHYADKRDVRTLEHELNLLTQGRKTIDEFFARVNHQLSLLINKIKTEDYSQETVNALTENYRNRALDIFIRGLNGDVSKMLTIQKPQTLPEAYTSCLEFQNLNFRNFQVRHGNTNNTIVAPINQMFPPRTQTGSKIPQITSREKNQVYSNQPDMNQKPSWNSAPPPRPTNPKPPQPMEVDKSIQSRQINYMNRPENKRFNGSDNLPRKQQRLFATDVALDQEFETNESQKEEQLNERYLEAYEEIEGWNDDAVNEDLAELNFTTEASLAYHT